MQEQNHFRHWDSNLSAIPDFLNQMDPTKPMYLWAPEEAEGINSDFIMELCNIAQKKIYIIFGSYGIEHLLVDYPWSKYIRKKISLRLWPNFFLYSAFYHTHNNHTSYIRYKKKYLFYNLNNKVKNHRCLMIDTLAQRNLLANNIFTWRNEDPEFSDYRFKYWNPTVTTVPEVPEFSSNGTFLFPMAVPPIVKHCIFSVVNESAVNMKFITEKTFFPIILGIPFLIYGCSGIHAFLNRAGFRLLPFVDYSFDKETDDDIRCKKLVDEIERLSKIPLKTLKKGSQKVCDYNQKAARHWVTKDLKFFQMLPEYYRNYIRQVRLHAQSPGS